MIGRLLVWASVALIMTVPGVSRATDHAMSVGQLVEALGEEAAESETRWRAAERLGRMGIRSERVVSALVYALGWDNNPTVRSRAAQALGFLGAKAEGAVEALIETLESEESLKVRWRVVEALERIGPATGEVAPVLIEVLRVMRAAIASNRARRFQTSPHRGKRAILRVDASVQGFGGTLKLIGGADDLGSGRRLAHG